LIALRRIRASGVLKMACAASRDDALGYLTRGAGCGEGSVRTCTRVMYCDQAILPVCGDCRPAWPQKLPGTHIILYERRAIDTLIGQGRSFMYPGHYIHRLKAPVVNPCQKKPDIKLSKLSEPKPTAEDSITHRYASSLVPTRGYRLTEMQPAWHISLSRQRLTVRIHISNLVRRSSIQYCSWNVLNRYRWASSVQCGPET
jgi:hypothetical protein